MAKHKPELSDQANVDAFNRYIPGYPYRPDVDMAPHIPDSCPNKAKVGGIDVSASGRKRLEPMPG